MERVCSKVTFAVSGANNSFDIKDAEDDTAVQGTITVKAWGLNILNTKYYPVKQLAAMFGYGVDGNDYSFWPPSKLTWNNKEHYRSFWAVDPNYSGDGSYLETDFTETPFSNLKSLLLLPAPTHSIVWKTHSVIKDKTRMKQLLLLFWRNSF